MTKLPTWKECEKKVNKGTATELEKFIFFRGDSMDRAWRNELWNVVLEIFNMGRGLQRDF